MRTMVGRWWVPWSTWLVAMVLASLAFGQDLRPYRTGLVLIKQDRHVEAARSWRAVAERLAQDAGSVEARRTAALGHVLSTVAYELAGDAQAYAQWGKAIEMFLTAQTRWADQREALRARREEIEVLFAGISADTDAREIDDETMFFLELEEATALTAFLGPRPGLSEVAASSAGQAGSEPERREYFARPLSVIQRENGGSRYTDPADNPELAASNLRRRAQPVDPSSEEEESPARGSGLYRGPRGGPRPPTTVVSVARDFTEAGRGAVRGQGAAGRQALEESDLAAARHAWRYIQENLQTNTGLVNSMNQYPRTTLWEVGSSIAAWVAAEQLQLIPRVRFQANVERLIVTLERMALYNDVLPNLEYDTASGDMVDGHGRPSERGVGWSALDIGRALIWLRILRDWYPGYREDVSRVVAGWALSGLVVDDELRRVTFEGGVERSEQQGRFGYEQYAAAGLGVWGIRAPGALGFEDVEQVEISGILVPYDSRPFSFLTSEPFMLAELELGGISPDFRRWSEAIYTVQRKRYELLNVLAAVSEDSLAQPPWFVYNTIFYGGRPWQALGPDGSHHPELAGLSVKAAFAWSAIYEDSFTVKLTALASQLRHERFGFLAGQFENGEPNRALSLNTNAIVLESVLFKLRGGEPFLRLEVTEARRSAVRRP